jgi:hypothetical protein
MLLNPVTFVVKDAAFDVSVGGLLSFVKSLFEMMNFGCPFGILAKCVSLLLSATLPCTTFGFKMRKAHFSKDVHTSFFPLSGLNCETLLMTSFSSCDSNFEKLMFANDAFLAIGVVDTPQYFPYLFQSPLGEQLISGVRKYCWS